MRSAKAAKQILDICCKLLEKSAIDMFRHLDVQYLSGVLLTGDSLGQPSFSAPRASGHGGCLWVSL